MEIVKKELDGGIIKLDLGADFNESEQTVSGSVELDIENQAYFVDFVNTVFDDGHKFVMVNMGNVSYIDSSGLWAIFEGHKKAVHREGELVLVAPTKDVSRVLDITKMSSKINVFETEEEASHHLVSTAAAE